MRKCPYCKIDVAGDLVKCPLCQSKLMGTEEEPCYQELEAQKKRSLLYKFQLFIAWALLIVGIGLDFTVGLRLPGYPNLHWSLLLAMWLFVIEFFIIRQFKPGTGPAGKVTKTVIATVVMWCITAHYLGFMEITFDLAVPSVLAATGIANFVLALVDKHGNTMAEAHLDAAKLYGYGIDAVKLNNFIYGNYPLPQLKLEAMAVERVQLIAGGRAAISWCTQEDLKQYGALDEHTECCIDRIRSIEGVEAAAFIKEKADGRLKVSLRSKSYADVNAVARQFDGGGHLRASGCTLYGSVEEAVEALKPALEASVAR